MERLSTLREALERGDTSPHDAALFLPEDEVWSLDTLCAVLDVDRYEDSNALPPFAQQHGLSRALSVTQVQDIVCNIRQQVADPSPEQLLAAFLFYYDKDAFIDLGK